MIPIIHFITGLIFALFILFISKVSAYQAFLIFFGTFFIDFDHYLFYIFKRNDFSLKNSIKYSKIKRDKFYSLTPKQRKNIKKPVYIFHNFESVFFLILLSLFYNNFLYILLGMLFHLLIDYIEFVLHGEYHYFKFSLVLTLILNRTKKIDIW
jgi:hypothetical protein